MAPITIKKIVPKIEPKKMSIVQLRIILTWRKWLFVSNKGQPSHVTGPVQNSLENKSEDAKYFLSHYRIVLGCVHYGCALERFLISRTEILVSCGISRDSDFLHVLLA